MWTGGVLTEGVDTEGVEPPVTGARTGGTVTVGTETFGSVAGGAESLGSFGTESGLAWPETTATEHKAVAKRIPSRIRRLITKARNDKTP